MNAPLIQVRELKKYFPIRQGLLQRIASYVRAVDGVSFEVGAGESFGLVGESSCGKTTLGLTVLRLLEPTSGEIWFSGNDITRISESHMNAIRPDMQVVFQNPFRSLNPHMRVKELVAEPLRIQKRARGMELVRHVNDLLEKVGLSSECYYRFPRDMSGGQRQRVAIARAIALQPRFIVLDEPTSALDVSVQAQVINLLMELQESYNLTYLFISHDLGVIRHVCNRVAVMYLGKIVEVADTVAIFERPAHPYTQALLSAIPEPDTFSIPQSRVSGEIRPILHEMQGCRFASRCPERMSGVCDTISPPLQPIQDHHHVACHLFPQLAGSTSSPQLEQVR